MATEKTEKKTVDTIKEWARSVKLFVTHWFQENTIVPEWVPKQLKQPLYTYLAAAAIQCFAIFLTALIILAVPAFSFRGALILLGVITVALTMGAAPGLLASFVGTLLLDLFLVSPTISFSPRNGAELLNVGFYLIVCLTTNMAASHAQRARDALRLR